MRYECENQDAKAEVLQQIEVMEKRKRKINENNTKYQLESRK